MDAVLMSIRPEFTEKIFNNKKRIELRKRPPSCTYPYTMFIYETKGIYRNDQGIKLQGAGAVVGYAVIGARIRTNIFSNEVKAYLYRQAGALGTNTAILDADSVKEYQDYILKNACVTREELEKYADKESIYGLVITEQKRYKAPRSLAEFALTRPPQSWQYIKDIE